MKHFYILIFLLSASVFANAQNINEKEAKQKIQEFSKKFASPKQLKSAEAESYALDSISYENGVVKKMTYNENGQLLTYKSYENGYGKIYLDEIETNTYNESGQMLSNKISKYDEWAEIMLDQWKYENTYDAQGRIATETDWIESDIPNELQYNSKAEYKYNENNTIEVIQYNWENQWIPDNKETMYVKWSDGSVPMVDSIHVYIPVNGSTDVWIYVGNITFKYFAPDLISEMEVISFDEETGDVDYKSKTETSYNNHGDILSDATIIFYPETQEWLPTSRVEYEYNVANQIITKEDFFRSWTSEGLVLSTKNTYEYDADGNLSTRKVYVSDVDNAEMILYNTYEFKFKNLNTANIMLPPASTGYYYNEDDFYEQEFYTNGAIDEVEHFTWNYDSEIIELQKMGKYHYSEHNSSPTSAKQFDKHSINVFPNPFTNEIKLQLNNTGMYLLKLTNGTGQVVYSANVEASSTHNVSDLPVGMYILSLTQNGETKANYKLIKK